jgi:hypothetical protein
MRTGNGTDIRCRCCGGEVLGRGTILDTDTGDLVELYQCRGGSQERCQRVIRVRVR